MAGDGGGGGARRVDLHRIPDTRAEGDSWKDPIPASHSGGRARVTCSGLDSLEEAIKSHAVAWILWRKRLSRMQWLGFFGGSD